MRNTLRTVLIYILMLALPAQAMAALGMQLCEQVHRSGMLQQMAGEHASHALTKQAGHEMHHSSQGDDSSPADGSLCALCAFCVGAAAASQPFETNSSLTAIEPDLAGPQRLTIGVADTPERPPRSFSV